MNVYLPRESLDETRRKGRHMSSYMLAQLQLKYGFANLMRYEAAMVTIRELFESQGISLVAGTVTQVGPLYEAFNLWEIEDQGHLERALGALTLSDPRALAAMGELDATVEHEQTRFLGSLAFAGRPNTA
ncbi:NIPSNAP family protein [Streptomyces olivaceus]|uniref:NIPSNAP family protein n=1 Tax=Streptomyces olivaceus TaxID=47716 RepID=UPI003663DB4C